MPKKFWKAVGDFDDYGDRKANSIEINELVDIWGPFEDLFNMSKLDSTNANSYIMQVWLLVRRFKAFQWRIVSRTEIEPVHNVTSRRPFLALELSFDRAAKIPVEYVATNHVWLKKEDLTDTKGLEDHLH